MNFSKEDKKAKSFYFFLIITAIPIIGVIIIFSLLYIHTKKEIDFTSHQLKGLDILYDVQEHIHYIQKIRGLSLINNIDEKNTKKLSDVKNRLSQNIEKLLT